MNTLLNPSGIYQPSWITERSREPSRSSLFSLQGLRYVWLFLALLVHSSLLQGQELTVSGIVRDENNVGLPAVNIQIKNLNLGTTTDVDGRYALAIDSTRDVTLTFSYVGFVTQEIVVGQRSVIDVLMIPSVVELGEIVIDGYSSQNKKDIASSISVVDVDEMKKYTSVNIGDQLVGKIPGVQVSTSGDPGSVQYVRVRGIGSLNGNDPLYVIDGVPIQNEPDMNFLNPNDIESMQVLKDASASIYGARAANGVVVITTKQGKGKSKLNVDFFTGMQYPRSFPEMANPHELLAIQDSLASFNGGTFNSQLYIKDAAGNWTLPDFIVKENGYAAGDLAVDPNLYVLNTTDPGLFQHNYPIMEANKQGTNWFHQLFQPAPMTSVNVSTAAGSEHATHYFSMNYYDQQSILIKNNWKRIQARLNNSYFVGKNFRLGENLNIAYQTGTGAEYPRLNVESAYTTPQLLPMYDIKGYWAQGNPVAFQTRRSDGLTYQTLRITGNVFTEFDFLKYFTLKTNAGIDYFRFPHTRYDYMCPECASSNNVDYLEKYSGDLRNWVLTGTLNFNHTFGDHKVHGLVGIESRDSYHESFFAGGYNLAYGSDPHFRELGNVSNNKSIGSERGENRLSSVFANINYTFKEKYILAFIVRRDGSSRFLDDKFKTFPAVSAGWRVSEEPFLAASKIVTNLKLRTSYGITGNNEVVGGDYPGTTSYGTSPRTSSYSIRGDVNAFSQGFAQTSSGNPALRWETSAMTNAAFDVTLVHKLDVTLEWYQRKTSNMIYPVRPPLETGNSFPINTNIGSMQNKGIDLQVTYRGKATQNKLAYSIGISGTHFRNQVLALDANNNPFVPGDILHGGSPAITRTQVGQPVSQFYGFIAEGLWQSQAQISEILYKNAGEAKPGRMKFKDVNGDGQITGADRTFIGNPLPKFILGFNLNLSYKNFDLTAYFNGVYGKKVFNVMKSFTDFNQTEIGISGPNRSKRMLYEAGKSLPVLDPTDNYSSMISTYSVEDGSYLQFRNLVIGYTFRSKTTKARIYIQGQNLFTWTKYSGLDPDVTALNIRSDWAPRMDLTTGVDAGRFPWSRQLIIGMNLQL